MQNRWVSPYREKYRSFSPYEMAKNGQLDELREFLDIYPDFLNKPWDGNGWHSPLIRHLDGLLDYSLSFESGSYLAGITALVLGVPLIPVVGTVGAYWSIEEDSEKKRYKGWTLLEFAAQTGKIAVAMHLVWLCDKHNIDLNRNPFLEVAARNGKHDFVSTLKREIKKLGKNRSNKNKAIELNKIANEATESLECRGVEILQAKSTLEDCNQRIKLLNSHMTIYEDKFKERSEQYIANLRAELVKSDNQINGEVIKWNEIVNGLIEMHKEIHGKSAENNKRK